MYHYNFSLNNPFSICKQSDYDINGSDFLTVKENHFHVAIV